MSPKNKHRRLSPQDEGNFLKDPEVSDEKYRAEN
jgi:hypothetical protein